MNDVHVITFSKREDIRGSLIPVESYKDIPFNIERLFYIKDMDKFPRGFHSHKKTMQVLVSINGSFNIDLTDGKTTKTYILNEDNKGIFIPHNIWLHMSEFTDDCIILVLCSYKYDENEYIRNFGDFVEYQHKLQSQESIKMISLTEQINSLRGSILHNISDLIDTGQFIFGYEHDKFEADFAKYNSARYCIGVSNGTSAIVCALKALNLQENSEVIVQSNTYIAAPIAIELCNLKIKIVDIDDTLNMNLDILEKNITEKTTAVLVVHLYGTCPDMHKLSRLKEKYGFKLIEDCAQAHGSTFDGKKLGTFGDIGCFSFYPTKNLGAFGDGGCIITNNVDYANFVRKYRNYGCEEKYDWIIKGSNERLDNIQAGILNIKLPFLDYWNAQRNKLATIYNKELADINEIKIIQQHPLLYRNYHLYVVLVNKREELLIFLNNNNIQCAIHYPRTFYKSSAFKDLNKYKFKADDIANRILSLPMYPELAECNVLKVCEKIKYFYSLI
jgi:dTDP-4-amino-4,6-dideoxygalactose transaminase